MFSGGGGQRKLSLIPMDTEGYNGQQLRSASNNGKIVLFLVPLQEDMDIDPLPFDAAEFSKMPQVPCVICQTTMPLQMLALHAGNCKPVSDVRNQITNNVILYQITDSIFRTVNRIRLSRLTFLKMKLNFQ